LASLDALRGWVIIVMALDHANEFIAHGQIGYEAWWGRPPIYDGDTLAFLTRAASHMAAPGFFFLMGAAMALFDASRVRRGWSLGRVVRYFTSRGGVLIALQLVVVNPAWAMAGGGYRFLYFGVLWALGAAMVLAGFLVRLRPAVLVAAGIALVAASEICAGLVESADLSAGLALALLPGHSAGLFVLYPVVPWLGVTLLGVAYGRWLVAERDRALRAAWWLGGICLVIFAVVRLTAGAGNIQVASDGDWIRWFNVIKYPPSAAFLGLTMGLNFMVLAALVNLPGALRRLEDILVVYGRAPLFFYVIHLYLYGTIGVLLGVGATSIAGMYPWWLLGLALMYPACRAYGRFKQTTPPGSIWRYL
jgi:uncharacterized membrane protein